MIKKVTSIGLVLVLTIFTANFAFADEKIVPPPSSKRGNFSKKEFSQKNSWSNKGKAATPPVHTGTGSTGGNRIPISKGLYFLMIGSTIYLIKKVRDENKKTEVLKNIENI